MPQKLFAVYLGGTAPKCNTELHDVVCTVGESIEATYEQLMDKWFGTPEGLHLDSWMELDNVEGYRISLCAEKAADGPKLYFVNLGAYRDGEFTEYHANKFIVADDIIQAKIKGKSLLLQDWGAPVHTDDLYEVDDCLEIGEVDGLYVRLEKTDQPERLKPTNGYHLIPKSTVQDYIARKAASAK